MNRPRKDKLAPRVPITIRVSPWIKARLEKEAKNRGQSLSETANSRLARSLARSRIAAL